MFPDALSTYRTKLKPLSIKFNKFVILKYNARCLFAAGVYIINLRRTWEKLLLAARAIAAIENPSDVCVISARPYGQRAVLKFASYVGATPIAGRFTPGTFTNQIQVGTYYCMLEPGMPWFTVNLYFQSLWCASLYHLLVHIFLNIYRYTVLHVAQVMYVCDLIDWLHTNVLCMMLFSTDNIALVDRR